MMTFTDSSVVVELMDLIYAAGLKNGGRIVTDELRYQFRCTKQSQQRCRAFQKAIEYLRILGYVKKPGKNGIWYLRDSVVPFWSPPEEGNAKVPHESVVTKKNHVLKHAAVGRS